MSNLTVNNKSAARIFVVNKSAPTIGVRVPGIQGRPGSDADTGSIEAAILALTESVENALTTAEEAVTTAELVQTNLTEHVEDVDNPHATTAEQVGADPAGAAATAAAAAQAYSVQRANHTGTQAQSTVTDLVTTLAAKADLVGGYVPTSQIPAIAITEYLGSVANQAAMLALSGQKGDWAIRSDAGKVYVITGNDPTQLADWTAMVYPTSPVTSVNGQTGVVVLTAADVGAPSGSGTSSGTNTGDQTSIAGISGTLAQFNAAMSDADFATGGGTASGTNTGDETGARVATLLHTASAKTTLVDADEINGTDSASSYSLIRVTCANVAAYLWTKLGALIEGGTHKSTPVGGDMIAIADSAASNATKYATLTEVFTALGSSGSSDTRDFWLFN